MAPKFCRINFRKICDQTSMKFKIFLAKNKTLQYTAMHIYNLCFTSELK